MNVSERGLRETVCGTTGCSDLEFISGTAGIVVMHLIPILLISIPLALVYIWIRIRKKSPDSPQ